MSPAPDIVDAIRICDRWIARMAPQTDLQRAWTLARMELRRRTAQSQRMLSVSSSIAQVVTQLLDRAPTPEVRAALEHVLKLLAAIPEPPSPMPEDPP